MIGVLLLVDRWVRVEPGARALDLVVEGAGRLLDASAGIAESYARLARELAGATRLVP